MDEPINFVTGDTGKKLDQTDEEVLRSAASGEGLVEIKSADALMELAQMAHETFQFFRKEVNTIMTEERAKQVRNWRVDEGFTWRAVAREAHEQFGGTWEPVSNQLAGMALCEAAAEFFGEHYMDATWND